MINAALLRMGLYAAIVATVIGGAGYFLYDWHYDVISALEEKVTTLEADNKTKDLTIDNLGVQIIQIIEDNKVVGFEEYFNGVADANYTVSDIDLIF